MASARCYCAGGGRKIAWQVPAVIVLSSAPLARIVFVPRSKHQSLIAVYGNNRCSVIHAKHTNTLCEQNVELLNVIVGVT